MVNAEPALNLHFVPERVLEILFAHYKLPAAGVRAILEARRATEVSPAGREQLLGGESSKSPLAPYLGLRISGSTSKPSVRGTRWKTCRSSALAATGLRVVRSRIVPSMSMLTAFFPLALKMS